MGWYLADRLGVTFERLVGAVRGPDEPVVWLGFPDRVAGLSNRFGLCPMPGQPRADTPCIGRGERRGPDRDRKGVGNA